VEGIFLSYRRAGGSAWAKLIATRLEQTLPGHGVFLDVDSIDPGVDFTKEIDDTLSVSRVMLVLIGTDWTTAADDRGKRRIDDPEDLLRIEVRRALESEATVIPLLLDGASMPVRDELPEDLKRLANHNALEIRATSFDRDADHLVERLRELLGRPTGPAMSQPPQTRESGRGIWLP